MAKCRSKRTPMDDVTATTLSSLTTSVVLVFNFNHHSAAHLLLEAFNVLEKHIDITIMLKSTVSSDVMMDRCLVIIG